MVPWKLILLALPLSATASTPKTFGVAPDLLSKYVPLKSGAWKCLDGSKEIPWDFVNDDSCDCPDGSDEPGTSACPDRTFYCQNEGHIGATIPSSRVNDGLCELDCCDGSDERPGVCRNICKEIGEEHRKKLKQQRKLQKMGAKVRSTYIAFAHKEKKRLEEEVVKLAEEIRVKEKDVQRLKEVADRTESISQIALEHKMKSPLFQSIKSHHHALRSLQLKHEKHLEREKALGQILDTLRTGYNPNYQDMAVLEAVRGWEELAGLPHINDVGKEGEAKEEPKEQVTPEAAEETDPDLWTPDQLGQQLDSLIKADHVGLLLEHEEHIQSPSEDSMLFDVAAYLPDSLATQYEELKETLVSWMSKLGIVRDGGNPSGDSSRARQAHSDAESELEGLKSQKEAAENDVAEIFDTHGFGAEGEWKKLDGTCLEKDTGDYTYEVCLFGEIKQKPNNGGTTFSLGKFESWDPSADVRPGEPAYYHKQVYKHGTRCWNGPERNVALLLECGTDNVILTVQELEKCEYQFTGTSPALCLPLDGSQRSGGGAREEL